MPRRDWLGHSHGPNALRGHGQDVQHIWPANLTNIVTNLYTFLPIFAALINIYSSNRAQEIYRARKNMPPPQRRRRGVSCPSNILPSAVANAPKAAEEEDEEEEEDEDQEMELHRRNDPRAYSEGDEDEEPEANDPNDDGGEDSANGQLVKKLVRYALACEFSRTPIRRDGIKDKGLLSGSVS